MDNRLKHHEHPVFTKDAHPTGDTFRFNVATDLATVKQIAALQMALSELLPATVSSIGVAVRSSGKSKGEKYLSVTLHPSGEASESAVSGIVLMMHTRVDPITAAPKQPAISL